MEGNVKPRAVVESREICASTVIPVVGVRVESRWRQRRAPVDEVGEVERKVAKIGKTEALQSQRSATASLGS